MWGSMSRKPGQPSEYMREIYKKALDEQRLAAGPGEKHAGVAQRDGLGGDRQEAASRRTTSSTPASTGRSTSTPEDRLLLPRQPPGDRAATPARPRRCGRVGRRRACSRACWPTGSASRRRSCHGAWRGRTEAFEAGRTPPAGRTGCSRRRARRPQAVRPAVPGGASRRCGSQGHRARTRCCTSARSCRGTSCRPRSWGCGRPCSPATRRSLAATAGAAEGPGQPPGRAADRAGPDRRTWSADPRMSPCPRALHPRPGHAGSEPGGRRPGARSAASNPHRVRDGAPRRPIVHMDPTRPRRSSATRTCGPTSSGCAGTCPDFPLLPGVLMCEAAAQLCRYYSGRSAT